MEVGGFFFQNIKYTPAEDLCYTSALRRSIVALYLWRLYIGRLVRVTRCRIYKV